MQDSCYIIFSRHGVERMTKRAPGLSQGEYAVKINLNAPNSLFNRFIPEATIEVPEAAVIVPQLEVEQPEPPEEQPEEELEP